MDKARLASELASGRSIEAIARDAGRDPSTVAYWVNQHGLVSAFAAKHAARGGLAREQLEPLVAAGLSIRAIAQRLEASCATVQHWLRKHGRRRSGRACRLCGYDRFPAALQFHHVDPRQKAFSLSHRGVTIALDAARAEAAKCVLLCANCHAEVEGGFAVVQQGPTMNGELPAPG